jgi:NADP-dependent 3-hydroxy acid dehydrogenase YdfG
MSRWRKSMKLEEAMTAVVTGAASGIGLAIATAFSNRGLNVVLADIEQGALDTVNDGLPKAKTLAYKTDVTNLAQVEALRDATLSRFGRVDLVCNNAGVFNRFKPMWELDIREWRWVIGVNLWGVVHGIHAFLPTLVAQGHGHIVNTASLAGFISLPGNAPYNVSKHGVVTLSEGLKAELENANVDVGVTVLCVGGVETAIRHSARNCPPEMLTEAMKEQAKATDAIPNKSEHISPAQAVERIIESIEAGQFYCATHPGFGPVIRERFEPIWRDVSAVT